MPDLLAFDFDGVICDGLQEYFQTAWQAYCRLYSVSADIAPPAGLAERFYRLRPVIETGWEMPVMLKALVDGRSDAEILDQWPGMATTLLEGFTSAAAAQAVDGIRDAWIQADRSGWLAQHRFYPGLLERLQSMVAQLPTYIISTKEGRFIRELLQQQGLDLAPELILGKEVKQPKYETLRQLQRQYRSGSGNSPQIWFVEDRLKALQLVQQQSDLGDVTLFLADWGYNLAAERQLAAATPGIQVLSLDRVVQKFDCWLE
jgi:phosphoglycolate phosphatase-like HAD superfamily hydrolase